MNNNVIIHNGALSLDKCKETVANAERGLAPVFQQKDNFRQYILRQCGLCEKQLQRYFCLDTDNAAPAYVTPVRAVDRILYVQLTNFLYDTYIRLLMSGYQQVVINHPSPVLACLKQVLFKLDSTTVSVAKPSRCIDLDSLQDVALAFDHLTLMFDEARKRGVILSLDLVLSEYVDNLPCSSADCSPTASLSPLIDIILRDHQVEAEPLTNESMNVAPPVDGWRLRVRWLSVFQTFYRPCVDDALIDHSRHREWVYIPVYRFGDDAVSAMSMSTYIGNTMRRNIRLLYDFIESLLKDLSCQSPLCPCVIIFNLFVRDYFRVYHSKSLPQTSFIQVYDDKTGNNIKISYMLIANKFPKISQWFSSINNQFLKKTGYARILHIDAYARLITSSCDATLAAIKQQSASKTKKKRQKRRLIASVRLTDSALSLVRPDERKKGNGRRVRFALPTAGGPTARRFGGKRKEKVTLSRLFDAGLTRMLYRKRPQQQENVHDKEDTADKKRQPQASILSAVYRSGFVACKHRHIGRVYTQKRAHDESASLSLFCHDCQCYL